MIYLVMRNIPYEGSDVQYVCATPEKAQECAKRYRDSHCDESWNRWTEINPTFWTSELCNIEIVAHEVES